MKCPFYVSFSLGKVEIELAVAGGRVGRVKVALSVKARRCACRTRVDRESRPS